MTTTMDLEITTFAQRPDAAAVFGVDSSWPEFMKHDPIGDEYYGRLHAFGDYVLVARDPTDGRVVARACSVPVHFDGELPHDGWDAAILSGLRVLDGQQPDAVSAIEIAIDRSRLGTGLSGVLLLAMRDNAARLGFNELVAPVRPNGKPEVATSMADHAFAVRDDGLPVDPWLRVHVRAGGVIEKVAPRSMVIPGTLGEWRAWTGLPFVRTGPVAVPGALTPVHCDAEHGTAVYVEPNVWVRHRTEPGQAA